MQQTKAIILDGKKVANEFTTCLKTKVEHLVKESGGKRPYLAVCLVGDDPASQVYVGHKERAAAQVGIDSKTYRLPADTKQEDLQKLILELNGDEQVNGILVQMPLPKGLDADPVLLQINPMKDVDGLHPFNLGMLVAGHQGLIPCTPFGIMRLLQSYRVELTGKKAVVIGRSRLVGKPIAQLLMNEHATVTVVHSRTPEEEIQKIIKESDIVVAALGKPNFVKAEWLKEGSVAIDVGINRGSDGKLIGDIEYEKALSKVKAITPVPGGVGPLTVAHLLINTVKAFEMQCFGYS
ncbi:MAG TPA: bifunctional methylenetetrahydrofolate dehydrogenase/methenyltetrahydrofolate cyclohydrolase FolD, partial [Vampirovibrionales bacterium]